MDHSVLPSAIHVIIHKRALFIGTFSGCESGDPLAESFETELSLAVIIGLSARSRPIDRSPIRIEIGSSAMRINEIIYGSSWPWIKSLAG